MSESQKFQLQRKAGHAPGYKGKTILVKNKKRVERALSIVDEGKDVTPKTLNPDVYTAGKERQLNSYEVSNAPDRLGQDATISGSPSLNMYRSQSTVRFRTDLERQHMEQSVQYKGSLSYSGSFMDVFLLDTVSDRSSESLLDTFRTNSEEVDIVDMKKIPTHLSLILSETNTFFLLDIPSSTVIKDTDEGNIVEEQNELYEYLTVGKGRNRKVVQAEVQTVPILMKTQNTDAQRIRTHNDFAFASIWEMYDTFQEVMKEKGEDDTESDSSEPEIFGLDDKSSLDSYRLSADEKQLNKLMKNPKFLEAACVIERLLANNCYNEQQKIFRGLAEPDLFREDIEYKYNLKLLWTFANATTQGKCVNAIHWNPSNKDLLAVGYGKYYFSDNIPGLVLIWNIKNPVQPERQYSFEEAVTALNFSVANPNLLAIGFYNGYIAVLNVISRETLIIGDNDPTFEPVWHISWEAGYFEHSTKELICATFSDGRICVYNLARKLKGQQIMRVAKTDGVLKGITSIMKICTNLTVPVTQYSSAYVLTSHPIHKHIYFIGTNEGIIHKCSTNYFNQHLDSFAAHDGPIHTMKFSPFCDKVFATCGDDWNTRFWAEGISEPLWESFVNMQSVHGFAWSPIHATIYVSIRGPCVMIWDIQRKVYQPQSSTTTPSGARTTTLQFTESGRCLVVGDIEGYVHMYSLENMPFLPFFQENLLFESLFRALITKPNVIRKLKKLRRSKDFDQEGE